MNGGEKFSCNGTNYLSIKAKQTFAFRAKSYSTILILSICLLFFAGCTYTVESEKTITLEKPTVSTGEIVENDELAELVLSRTLEKANPPKSVIPKIVETATPVKPSVAEVLDMAATENLPPDSTKLITLPKLSGVEINELAEQFTMTLGTKPGYTKTSSAVADSFPAPPAGLIGDLVLTRKAEEGTYILRFGYRQYVSQLPQLWCMGVVVDKDGKLAVNPDLALVEPEITKMIAALNAIRAELTVGDLEPKLIQLSYVDTETALSMLSTLGITTVAAGKMPPKIDYAQLPYVISVADPKADYTGLVGAKTQTSGSKLSLTPGVASEMSDNAVSSPMTQLLVLFHPAHPEQFSKVRNALDEYIDRPARQIFIEGMVLEISEQGLKELGVDWELNGGPLSIFGGSTTPGISSRTLSVDIPDTRNLRDAFSGDYFSHWDVNIRALIRSNKAEVLSRPSVLTLNNRQSTIRVGTDLPIASSLQGSGYSSLTAFKFEYLPIGILLNIRPRISEDGKEVTMLIDTIVSARVPGEDLELISNSNEVLASAPTVSTRRVQTYGRIANNTPLIIGGLVSNDKTQVQDKVPLLGDIPILGMAFRGERNESVKREVIIVLTPHVLPEKKDVRRSYPKDEDNFDNFGNDLFRDSYRIRGEDVFDLTFLLENKRIATYRNLAREAASKNFRLSEVEPFKSFVSDSIPGESILVSRMIYEVIKRLDIAAMIDPSRIIYFKSQQVGGYDVKFLDTIVTDEATGKLKDFDGKVLAITYHVDRASLEEGRLGSEPIPSISMIDCPDRDTWTKLLWELNQPAADGRERYTILIQDESDIVRLRRALALKRIAVLNGGLEHMRLKNFSVGKVLLMPELKEKQIHVIDSDTARFFFHTELYYAATLSEIEIQLKELDKMLRQTEINVLLDSPLPNGDEKLKVEVKK